ncbi:MAG TPA: CAP domain-containing protein [Anaerolineales bacterium]|jgi:LysM repeat protein
MPNSTLRIYGSGLCLFLVFSLYPFGRTQADTILSAPPASAADVIAAVNSLRASNGLPPYTANPILMQIAQAHADYMAATSTVTHYSADGSRPFQRALAAGYSVAGDLSRGGWFSENIQAGTGLSPSGAVTAWQGDAPHLNTMLSANLFDVGAGVSQNGSVVYYVLDAGASGESSGNPGLPGTITAPGTPLVSQFMVPVTLSTPGSDGFIYHEVQYGQTLWSIAIAYDTKIDLIKSLNNLSTNDLQPGQRLLIKQVPTPVPATDTPVPSATTSLPTEETVLAVTGSATATQSPSATPAAGSVAGSGGNVAVIIILSALLFAGLGTWLGTRRPV